MLPEETNKTYETLEFRPSEKIEIGSQQFVYSFIEVTGVILAMIIIHFLIKYRNSKALRWMKINPMFVRMFVKDLTGAVSKTVGDKAVKEMKEKDVKVTILDTVDPAFFKKYGDMAKDTTDVTINKDINQAAREDIEKKEKRQ